MIPSVLAGLPAGVAAGACAKTGIKAKEDNNRNRSAVRECRIQVILKISE
jgi:hypothetical protein